MRMAFLILSLLLCSNAQLLEVAKSLCEERAQQVLKSLAPDNPLRLALERGHRGTCIRQPWMDKMQQFGIKQVSFLVEYSWERGKVSFKITEINYHRDYYSYQDDMIKDRKLLRRIKGSGLEKELRDTIMAMVKSSPFAKRSKD